VKSRTIRRTTPVHEAASLQRDLRRAEIEPYAWVINQCLSPLSIQDPLLQERQLNEYPCIREVMEEQSQRTVLIPWQKDAPVGKIGLEHLSVKAEIAARRKPRFPTIGLAQLFIPKGYQTVAGG
jgi:arsenite-transporting ATPase